MLPRADISLTAGIKDVLVRNANHSWRNKSNGAFSDRIEYMDFGTNPYAASRKELMALGEKLIQDEGVTSRRKFINDTKENLGGGEQHIAFVIVPDRLHWKA